MKTRVGRLVACAVFAAMSINVHGSAKKEISQEKLVLDQQLFPGMYWGQPLEEIKAVLGEPLSSDSQALSTTFYYRGPQMGSIPTAMALGFDPEELRLQSARLFLLSEHEDNPELYMEEYNRVHLILTESYGDDTRFDWYSIHETPSFTGAEIVAGELTIITIWERETKIVSHTMILGDGHVAHSLVLHDPKKQDVKATLRSFESWSQSVLTQAAGR